MSVKNARDIDRRGFVGLMGALGAGVALGRTGVARAAEASGAGEATGRDGLTFTPGTYEAQATGKNGPVPVKVEFSEHAILSVSVGENHETNRISTVAIETLPQAIVDAQSTGVDSVSGATLTSYAIKAAVEDCAAQAGGDVDLLSEMPEDADAQDASPAHVDLEADVVVVGAGAAGMGAAITAAKEGAASVIILEKGCCTGGNLLVSGGYLEYIDAPDELRAEMNEGLEAYMDSILDSDVLADYQDLVATVRQEYEDYKATGSTKVFDSSTWYVLDGYSALPGMISMDACYKAADNCLVVSSFLNDLGMQWRPLIGYMGYVWPRSSSPATASSGQGYYLLFDDYFEKEEPPIETYLHTSAKSLLTQDGRVTGVEAEALDGTTYTVRASKGVILCTGGYSGSAELLREYNTLWPWEDDTPIPTTNNYGHTGDGLRMCQELGAQTANLDAIELFPLADPATSSVENIVGDSGDALMVGPDGRRFVNETGTRTEIVTAMMELPDSVCYVVSDQANSMIDEEGKTYYGADVENEIACGRIFRGDTIEACAEWIGCDPDVLAETVANFNAYAAAYDDPDFGRTTFTDTAPVDEPPFYVCPRTWAAHTTEGGVVVDGQSRVLDEGGAPIEGLYAAGEIVDGDLGVSNIGNGVSAARSLLGL